MNRRERSRGVDRWWTVSSLIVFRYRVRSQEGEVKALLSHQQTARTIKFGDRPSSAGNYRSMAKPNSANEPGPGRERNGSYEILLCFLFAYDGTRSK
jgi:hypothetical protein